MFKSEIMIDLALIDNIVSPVILPFCILLINYKKLTETCCALYGCRPCISMCLEYLD